MYFMYDTETLDTEECLAYDFGFAVHDAKGIIVHKDHYLIKEVVNDKSIMDNIFYKKNIPFYNNLLRQRQISRIPYFELEKLLEEIFAYFKIDVISAYNLMFDLRAISHTRRFAETGFRMPRDEDGKVIKQKSTGGFTEYIKKLIREEILHREINFSCLYGMATAKLFDSDKYIETAIKQKWINPETGNIYTGAEYAYRFVTNDFDFIERHTALEDVLIEVEIFAECMKIAGEYNQEFPKSPPYQIVMQRYKQLGYKKIKAA